MNSFDRIKAVIELEIPDRVPVGPLLDHYAATYAGITNAELMLDADKRIAAVLKTMRELGPWDITYAADTANATLLKLGLPMKLGIPGVNLDKNEIHQAIETEFFTVDDYDLLKKLGVFRFMWNVVGRLHPEMKGLKAFWPLVSANLESRKHRKMIEKAGARLAAGFIIPGILMEYFSFGRSMQPFIIDTFDRREKIVAVNRLWTKGVVDIAIKGAKFVGEPTVFLGCSRTSPAFNSPKLFEELALPEYEYAVNTLIDAGMTPLLHCDTDWTKFLPYFKNFPAKKCILELDGSTDIRKAKEILGDRMCIMGDVPATLSSFGSKDEVMNYCRSLIKDIGKGGGFILSSGCSIPANAKPENVKAMAEAVEEWGRY